MPKFKKGNDWSKRFLSKSPLKQNMLGGPSTMANQLMGQRTPMGSSMGLMPEEQNQMGGAFYQKEEIKIPTKDERMNKELKDKSWAVTDANIKAFADKSGYSVDSIKSFINEMSDESQEYDDFDMSDVISAMRDRYEGNVDEMD